MMDNSLSQPAFSRLLIRALLQRRERGEISEVLRHKARLHVADAVGIALAAAHGMPLSQQLQQAMRMGAQGGACSVWGSTDRLPPTLAAYVNAALIHALDYDDIHDISRLHPTAVTLPAALAAAQMCGAPAARVLDAVVLGGELMCRLGAMLRPQGQGPGSDWFLTQLFGYFGAALAAGVVLDLSEDQLVAAFGFAYMQAAGGKEAGFGVGCTGRSIYPAFAAMGGVLAAQLSMAGLTGPASALDGAANLFRVYLQGDPSAQQQAWLLGVSRWEFLDTCIKPWPSCRLSHPYVAAALQLRAQLRGEALQQLQVRVNASAAKLCHPLPQRRQPATLQDAKYSVPFMTAFALVHGAVRLDTLQPTALVDTAVAAVARCITVTEDLPDCAGHPPAQLQALTVSGRVLHSASPGDFPMEAQAVRDKFVDCLRFAGMADRADAAWAALYGLDEAAGVQQLFCCEAAVQPRMAQHP